MKKSNVIISVIMMLSLMSIYVPNVMAEAEEEDSNFMPFTVGVSDTPHNVDPANAYDSVSYDTLNQVYEGLYKYNLTSRRMEIIPQLAHSMGLWDTTFTNLTVELREDVTFHDGTAFNAAAVKWNFDRINFFALNERSDPYTLYLNDEGNLILNRTEIINDWTVKFVLNKPYPIWEQMLAFTGSFIVKPEPAFAEEFLTLSDPTIGTGPFKLIEIIPDTNVTFERNMEYYSGPANISKMVYTVIKDGQVASTAMLNHELHYGEILDEHLAQAEADPDITVERVKTNVVFYLQLGYHTIPYGVRKAMQFAWNYTYYLEETMQGEAYELHTPIPDGMQYHNPNIEGLPYYNVALARQFLIDNPGDLDNPIPIGLTATSPDSEWAAVAFGDTPLFSANFTRYTSTDLEKIKTQLIDNYADIGVNVVDWHIGDFGDWMEWCITPENIALLDISFGCWRPDYNDAINMIEPIYKTNATYNFMQLNDTILDDMMSVNCVLTRQARADSFDAIVERLIVDLAPCFYIKQRGGREVYNNKFVSNIKDMLNIFNYMYWYNVRYMRDSVPPLIISPENIIYAYETTGNEISWDVSDLNPDSYNISRDGINIIDSEPWISGIPIVINVDDLSPGSYEFNLTIWDIYGMNSTDIVIVEVIDPTPPLIIPPEIIIYVCGTTGNEISWDVSDSDPDSYNISRDGINIINSEPWISGIPIVVNVDDLSPGIYEFNLTIWDIYGIISTDIVMVEVISPILPTLNHPEDISYTVDTIYNNITWIATDSNPNLYSITRDGIEVNSGSWTSDNSIMINIDGLSEGTYNFTIVVTDLLGYSASDTVIVNVTSDSIPGYPIGFLIINTILVILGVVWKQRILKSEN